MDRRHKNMAKIEKIMAMIVSEQPLPPEVHDHPLSGNWDGKRECHIEPGWLLVYRIDKTTDEVVFYRTGSHSDLF
jgi:mRNA interferase YafQ